MESKKTTVNNSQILINNKNGSRFALKSARFTVYAFLAVWAAVLQPAYAPAYAEGAEARTYNLLRAPQLSPTILAKTWQPFVDYLSKETGVSAFLAKIPIFVIVHPHPAFVGLCAILDQKTACSKTQGDKKQRRPSATNPG